MKKYWLIILVASVMVATCGCQNQDKVGVPTGTFGIDSLKYLSPTSALTEDDFLKKNKGVTFVVGTDEFTVDTKNASDSSIKGQCFTDVSYEAVGLGNTLSLTDEETKGIDLSKFDTKKAFLVFSKNTDTGYTLYVLDDKVWISYLDLDNKNLWTDYLVVGK